MSENKIGSDVLGGGGSSQGGMSPQQRERLMRKMREAKAKKQLETSEEKEELNGRKLPKLEIPGDRPPEPKPGTCTELDKFYGDGEKPVKVVAHRRGKPHRQKAGIKALEPLNQKCYDWGEKK